MTPPSFPKSPSTPSWPAALADLARQHRSDLFVLAATPVFLVLATLTGLALIRAS